jgi:purine-binding chemotaxis protein CheW
MSSEILDIFADDLDYEDDSEDSLDNKYLIFSLDDKDYGISVNFVTEIIGMQKISEIPEVPFYIRGVTSLRNRVIPILDVRKRFQMEEKEDGDRTCLVILQIQETPLALVVDNVREVITIAPDAMEEAPSFGEDLASRFIANLAKINGRVKIILNVPKLLKEDEFIRIQNIANEKGK